MWFFCDFGYFDRLLEGNFFLIHFEGVSQVFLSKKCLSKGQKTIFWCQKCPATALPLNGGGRQGCTRGCSGVWHQLSLPNSSASSVITQRLRSVKRQCRDYHWQAEVDWGIFSFLVL